MQNLFKFRLFLTLLLPVVFMLANTALYGAKLPAFTLKPNNFYFESVTDARADKKPVALLIPVQPKPANAPAINLQAAGIGAVERYINQNVAADRNLRPVIINVKKLAITETRLADGRVDGLLTLSFSYELKTGNDMWLHLVNYNAGRHYIKAANQAYVAEAGLAQAVDNSITFFNNWMQNQADTNPLLAKRVELAFTDYKDDSDADTVYYDAHRPLTWADFRDHPRSGIYAAEVVPGLGYTEKTWMNKGVINIAVAMKVFMPKSAAWVRLGYTDDVTLNHEQRHFDIIKIISERFKKRMLAEKLPVFNYDGYINVAYFDALRELDAMQKQYDHETGHGINFAAQAAWNKLIDAELAAAKTYAAN